MLDTNVISALMRVPPVAAVLDWVDLQPRTSVWTTSITVMEIETGVGRLAPGKKREMLLDAWQDLFEVGLGRRVVSFDEQAARAAARLTNTRERAGITVDVRDTQIAGIALARGATLATRNIRHFQDLRIPVIDPWAADPSTTAA